MKTNNNFQALLVVCIGFASILYLRNFWELLSIFSIQWQSTQLVIYVKFYCFSSLIGRQYFYVTKGLNKFFKLINLRRWVAKAVNLSSIPWDWLLCCSYINKYQTKHRNIKPIGCNACLILQFSFVKGTSSDHVRAYTCYIISEGIDHISVNHLFIYLSVSLGCPCKHFGGSIIHIHLQTSLFTSKWPFPTKSHENKTLFVCLHSGILTCHLGQHIWLPRFCIACKILIIVNISETV